MPEHTGPFWGGAGLVWRRQLVLWWIYVLNLVLSLFAIHGMVESVGGALNHSLAADRLVHGFDLSAIGELMAQPDMPLQFDGPSMLHFAIVFAIGMLFLTGGLLAVYYRDAHLTTGLFFEACGECFWRFFRLMIYFLIATIPIALIGAGVAAIYDRIDEQSISPFPTVWFAVAGAILLLFLAMCLRLWFDMAQVIAVAEDERRMHAALRRAATLFRRNFGSLFWLYLRISVVAMLVFALVLQLWKNYLPPERIAAAWVISQLLMIWWLATRLWQRASEVIWYRRHLAQDQVPVPVEEPVPVLSAPAAAAPATRQML
jgi:hypothetical protein